MIEPLSFVLGAAAVAVGVVTGRVVNAEFRPSTPRYLCASCNDGYGLHDPEQGCQAQHLVVIDNYGRKKLQRCPCLRYDGPKPPPDYDEILKELP